MTKINYHQAHFLLSVADLIQLPPDEGGEIAIVGRSNAGKSSVLNQLTHNKTLSRVSKTPGRTQHINLFALDTKHRIADLPGFGYAKVPNLTQEKWQTLVGLYLETRECLKGVILVMDIRHPLKDTDRQFISFANECNFPVHILLNKTDKLSFQQIKKTVQEVNKVVLPCEDFISLQTFSAKTGNGVKELCLKLDEWFAD
ncbi:MAG TPA: ribosome biogenesis GTP-binding protein YihA/YsxC [Gammaproteobacteria bacterium]|jgi:GTP-binding protein|nr:ribosome biogenesis GTP-binding protein YihA/YsxC [Gammaproteobacteria bacterium]